MDESKNNASPPDAPQADADAPRADTEVTAEGIIEALLFSTDTPIPAKKLAQLARVGDAGTVKQYIEALNRRYAELGSAFRVEAIAKGYQMLTLPVYHRWIAKLHKARAETRLSPAALETLAIVAYKQPVMRAQIEAIRGVAVGEVVARLRDMNLVKIVGRAEEIGRPLLYGTTKKLLEVMGLNRIEDLPQLDDNNPAAIPKLKIVEETPEAPPEDHSKEVFEGVSKETPDSAPEETSEATLEAIPTESPDEG